MSSLRDLSAEKEKDTDVGQETASEVGPDVAASRTESDEQERSEQKTPSAGRKSEAYQPSESLQTSMTLQDVLEEDKPVPKPSERSEEIPRGSERGSRSASFSAIPKPTPSSGSGAIVSSSLSASSQMLEKRHQRSGSVNEFQRHQSTPNLFRGSPKRSSPGPGSPIRHSRARNRSTPNKDRTTRSQKPMLEGASGAGTIEASSMSDLFRNKEAGSVRRIAATAPKHSSVSHLNYHARKNDDDWSDSSDFELEWRPPVTKKDREPQNPAGMLAQHLQGSKHLEGGRQRSQRSMMSKHNDSVASIDVTVLDDSQPLTNKIGDLKHKPVTAASQEAQAKLDKSASTTMFARKDQTPDQSVNLMAVGQYETGSNSSDSRSARSKSSRTSIGSGSALNAPGRPGKYSSSRTPKSDPSTSYMNASLLDFMSDPRHRPGRGEITEESEATQRTRGSSDKAARRRSHGMILVVVMVILVAAAALVLFILPTTVVKGVGEASKSGDVYEANEKDVFRDGVVVLPAHHTKINLDATSKMSELTQEVTNRNQKLSEMKALIVQHGVSRAEDLSWKSFHYDYEEFVTMSPQSKALIWLANQGMRPSSAEDRDIQHHKLLQRYALAVFYYSTHDANRGAGPIETMHTGYFPTTQLLRLQEVSSWIHSDGWLTNETVCSWYGVQCNEEAATDEVIISLNISHNGLHGTLPVHELTQTLRWELLGLDLSGNTLFGTIGLRENKTDDEWFSWPKLQSFHLQDNRLSGHIPIHWLLGCPALEEINLSGNHFDGTLPDHAFELLDNLRRLNLDNNGLFGTVPVLGHLQKLEHVDLQNNAFSGRFPLGIFMLTTLVELRMGGNRFGGSLSTDLVNMINLEILSVENNRLEGHVPDVFYTLPNMTQLLLRGNNFTGPLPPSLGAMENLEALALESNNFAGSVPSELSGLTRLESLLLFHNNLSGSVPQEVCALKEGFFHFKKLHHIGADCLTKVECSCCDECY